MPDVSLSGIEFTIKGNSNAASDSIKNLTNQINKLNAALSKSKSVGNLSNQIKKVGDSAKTASKSMGKLASSILRVGFYRMIRSGIKGVTDAFREGLQNAYQFSKINGGALAESLDLIATKSLTMKNQLGAAFGALITAVTPIVLQLISLITRLANALSMLFAALGGQAQYKKAVDVWTEWGEAAGGAGAAAKEALKYLAPFDELNRLPDDRQGGGGGGAATPDFSEMFEYQDLPEWLQHFADKMSELASSLKITFNDVFFDWSDLTGEQIAEKAIVGLSALVGAGVGFMIGGVPGAIVGTLIGAAIGLEISAMTFDHDGVLSRSEIASMVSLALSALCGGIIGFTVGGPAGALIGAAIGIGVSAAITGVEFSTSGQGSGWQGLNYFVTEVLGMPTDEEWKQYGRNIWNWIVEGFQDFVGELKNIFVQPIIDAFSDFSFRDIVGGNDSGNGESGNFNLTATITDVVDKIPGAKKIIDGIKGIFGSTDNGAGLDESKRTIRTWAQFTASKIGLTESQRTIRTWANFTAFKNSLTESQRTIRTWANYTASKLGLTESARTIRTWANYTASKMSLTDDARTIRSWANFTASENSLSDSQRTFSSYAQMVEAWWASWIGWDKQTLEAYAEMIDAWWKDDAPTMDVYANLILDYDTNNPGYVMGGSAKGGIWGARGKIADIPQYASGGRLSGMHGSLFLAGEAGAELVGHVGGRTEVLNRSQLASTMYAAVRSAMSGIAFNVSSPTMGTGSTDDGANEDMLYRAFLRALNDADMDDRPIELDGNVLYRSMVNRNRQNTRLTGVNAMA